jgi:hypothetical protein
MIKYNEKIRIVIVCVTILFSYSLKGQVADVSKDETITGAWTYSNPLRLYSRKDGKVLLRFDTDREWFFKQSGADSNASLSLVSKVNNKYFSIADYASGKRTVRFQTNGNGGFVHLVPDGGYVIFPGGRILSNGRVGIGTDSPSADLDISGSLKAESIHAENINVGNRLVVNNTFGNNSNDPKQNKPFTIKRFSSENESYQIFVQDASLHHVYTNDESVSSIDFRIINLDTEAGDRVNANDRVVLSIKSGPTAAAVTMNGSLTAEEVKVELLSAEDMNLKGTLAANNITLSSNGNTADFVFDENYSLRSLDEVEDFIKTNGHLPSIPSAENMEKNGVNLAEMNKLLLQKIEELTLYAIEQDEKLKRKNDQVSHLANEIEKMKTDLVTIKTMLLNDSKIPQ